MNHKIKTKVRPHTVTFEGDADAQALALAQLGQSNRMIMADTGLSDSQITYRLSKAKNVTRAHHGFRVQWRNGESELFQRIRRDMLGILKKEIQRSLPGQIQKPTPMTVNK